MAESSSSLSYGLVVHLQLLSTPFRKDAVTFGYNDQIIIGKDFHLSDLVRSKAHRPTASLASQRSPHRLGPVLSRLQFLINVSSKFKIKFAIIV